MKTWKSSGVTFEGCTCPTGQVLSQDVSAATSIEGAAFTIDRRYRFS